MQSGLTNGHAGGDGMWVDDEVRHNAVLCPGHVLLVVGDANGALLPMATRKLVTHLGYPDRPHLPWYTLFRRLVQSACLLNVLFRMYS